MFVEFATPKDTMLLYEIEKQCFSARNRWTKRQFEKLLDGRTVLKVVNWGGEIYGFLAFSKNYIETIDVRPDKQGKGAGNLLMEYAERMIREQDYNHVYLHVFTKNTNAQKLYLKRGYEVVGLVKNYYRNGEHALKMEKPL